MLFNIGDLSESLLGPEHYLNWVLQIFSSSVIIITVVAIVYWAFIYFYPPLGYVENMEVLICSQWSKKTEVFLELLQY